MSSPTCAPRCTTSGIAGCSGSRSTPASRRIRTCTRCTPMTRRSAAPRRAGARPGATSDGCPTPPGATADGCVVSGRLSRLTASGNAMVGAEQVLIEDWCQQYPSHSIGVARLRAATARSTCPAATARASTSSTTARTAARSTRAGIRPAVSGRCSPRRRPRAARSAARTCARSPTRLRSTGRCLRVDPATGAGLPDNPNARQPRSQRAADRRVRPAQPVPDRCAARHRRGVGRGRGLERVGGDPAPPEPDRRAWSTSAGPATRAPAARAATTPRTCRSARTSTPRARRPSRRRCTPGTTARTVVPGETCPTGSSSAAGIAFAPTDGPYPSEYRGALFFADYSRDCIWAMLPGANGVPDPARLRTFAATAANPVYLQTGPGGDLFYADFDGGTIRRVSFTTANQAPTAVATATPDDRQRPVGRPVRRLGLERPGRGRQPHLRLGPRRRRPARRLHRRVARATPTPARASTPPACASPTATTRPVTRPSRSTSATPRPRRPSPRPRPAPPGASAT